MNGLIETVSGLHEDVLLMLLNVLWQCSAVFLVAFAAIKIARPPSAATRHFVWLLALAGVAFCPLAALMMQRSGTHVFEVALPAPVAAVEPVDAALPREDMTRPDEDNAFRDEAGYPDEEVWPEDDEFAMADDGFAGGLDAETDGPEPQDDAGNPITPPPQTQGASADSVRQAKAPGIASTLRHNWPAAIVLAWAVGCIGLILRLAIAQLAVVRLMRKSKRLDDRRALGVLMRVKQLAGAERHVEFRVSDRLAVPVAAGIFRPVVMLPRRLLDELSEDDLEAIAAHELTHINRRDPLVRLLEQVVHAVLFFHPVVWLIVRELNVEREAICDEAVVRITQRPLEYAKCLTSLHEQIRALPRYKAASLGVAHYRSRLVKRVEAILSGKLAALRRLSRRTVVALVAAACLSLGLIAGTGVVQKRAVAEAAEPQDAAAEAEPQQGCAFSGRVTDEAGDALSDVEILAWAMDRDQGTLAQRTYRSGTDGSFEIAGLPPADNSFFFRKEGMVVDGFHGDGRDFVTVRFQWPGQRKENVQVHMAKAQFIEGVVLDEAGEPVEGATVDTWSYAATSGSDGTFKVPDPATRNLTARMSVPGYARSIARYRGATEGETWTITLSKGCTVSGRVVNAATGEPVGGARLMCPRYEVDKIADEDGTYMLEHLPATLLHFLVRKGNLVAEVEIDCTPGEDRTGFDIALKQGGTIAGRMGDAATGEPLANAPIAALARYFLSTEAKSDENGFYKLVGLAPGEHALFPDAVYAGQEPGFSKRVLHVDEGQAIEGIDFEVESPEPPKPPDPNQPRIDGKVLDERGRPLSDVSLLVFAEDDPEPRKPVGGLGQTDITGEFTSLSRYYTFDTGKRYLIRASHRIYGVKEIAGVTIPERTKRRNLTIVFERFVSVSGRVIDPDGQPIAWAQIFVCKKSKAVPEANGYRRYRWDASTRRIWTDADGSYEVLGLANGSYVVEVEHEDYFGEKESADVEISDGQERTSECDFVLTAYEKGFIAGRVVDENGDPVPGAAVRASRLELPRSVENTHTDKDGKFRFDNLNAGTFRLQAWGSQQAGRLDEVSINTADVTLRTERSRLRAEPSLLHAKFVDANGDPITVFTVQSSQRSQPVEHHSEAGEYREEYSIRRTANRKITVTAGGYKTMTVEFELVEGETSEITITMVKGGGALETAGAANWYRWVNEGGPYVGSISAFAVDPRNSDVIYAGGLGGLYKSVDGAKTWHTIKTYCDKSGAPIRVYDIAIDTANSDVVYVESLPGLFKTTDGGRSWDSIVDTFSPIQVELDPTDPSVLYATDWDRRGVFKSSDGGLTWDSRMKGLRWPPLRPLRLDPNFPRTLYAVCEKAARFSSDDGGRSWRMVIGNIEDISVKSFKQDPDNDRTFTVTISYNGDHVFKTTNRGGRWSPDPPREMRLYLDRLEIEEAAPGQVPRITLQVRSPRECEIGLTRDGAETWKVIQVPCERRDLRGVRVDPHGRGFLYLGTEEGVYYYSADDGETWELLYSAEDDPKGEQTETIALLRELFLYGIQDGDRPVERTRLVVDPSDPRTIYHLDSDRGLRKSEDGGQTWTQANHGLVMFNTWTLACSRTEPGVVYASGWAGFFRTQDSGKSWQRLAGSPYGKIIIAPHPDDSHVILASGHMGRGAAVSVDGGKNWERILGLPGDATVTGFVFDSKQAKQFHVLTTKGIWETGDGGQTWNERAVSKQVDYAGFERVQQTSADIIYLPQGDKEILKSTDVGKTWEPIEGLDLERDIELLQVDPLQPEHVVLRCRGSYFRSTNAGEQWHKLGRIPVAASTIAMDPRDPTVLYLAESDRVVRTRDGGETIEELSNGLPLKNISRVDISPVDGSVYAGARFFGVFRLITDETPDGAASQGARETNRAEGPGLRTAAGEATDAKAPKESDRWVNEGGPYGGFVASLAIAASDPAVLYAGSSNGVFKTTDGAKTWKPAAELIPDRGRRAIHDVEVDPSNSDVVYATNAWPYKSADGGATWRLLQRGRERWGRVWHIEIDPKHPRTVYVVDSEAGVFKSTDGGVTWESKSTGLLDPDLSSFTVDPNAPEVLVGVTNRQTAIYSSDDGGATWRKDSGTVENVSLRDLERDPEHPRNLKIVLVYNDTKHIFENHTAGSGNWRREPGSTVPAYIRNLVVDKDDPMSMHTSVFVWNRHDVYLTTDGGEHWRVIKLPFDSNELKGLRASPRHTGILYAGTKSDVYYFSDDGGDSWSFFYSAEQDPGREQTETVEELRACFLFGLDTEGVRLQRPVADPVDANTVYNAERGVGVLKTKDYGKTWTRMNNGLVAFQVAGIACDSRTPGLVYVSGTPGIHKSANAGRTWEQIGPGVWASPFAQHPLDPNVLLAGTEAHGRKPHVSTDGGKTWHVVDEISSDTWVRSFLFDSTDADKIYMLTEEGTFETADRGRTWRRRSAKIDVMRHGSNGNFPGICQTRAEIVYEVRDNKTLFKSMDLGETWQPIDSLRVEGEVMFVQVRPDDPRIVAVAGYNGRLYISKDAGKTWRKIQAPIRDYFWATCIGFDPNDQDTFYVGGWRDRHGVARTRDGGRTFEELGAGLPKDAFILPIVVSPTDGNVYVGTNGYGVYQLAASSESARDRTGTGSLGHSGGRFASATENTRTAIALERRQNQSPGQADEKRRADEIVAEAEAKAAAIRRRAHELLAAVTAQAAGQGQAPGQNPGENTGQQGPPDTPGRIAERVAAILEQAQALEDERQAMLRQLVEDMTDDELVEAYAETLASKRGEEPEPLDENTRRELLAKIAQDRQAVIDEVVACPPVETWDDAFRNVGWPERADKLEADLVELGPGVVPVLLDMIEDGSVSMEARGPSSVASMTLCKMSASVRDVVLERWDTASPEVRNVLIYALQSMADPALADMFIEGTADKDTGMHGRFRSARWLARFGDARAVEPLLKALGDEDAFVRREAITGLARLGDRDVIPALETVVCSDVIADPVVARSRGKYARRDEADWAIRAILGTCRPESDLKLYEELPADAPADQLADALSIVYVRRTGDGELIEKDILVRPEPTFTKDDFRALRLGLKTGGETGWISGVLKPEAVEQYIQEIAPPKAIDIGDDAFTESCPRLLVTVRGTGVYSSHVSSIMTGTPTLWMGPVKEARTLFPELADDHERSMLEASLLAKDGTLALELKNTGTEPKTLLLQHVKDRDSYYQLHFELTGPDGQTLRYSPAAPGNRARLPAPKPDDDDLVELAAGKSLRCEITDAWLGLDPRTFKPGEYEVSVTYANYTVDGDDEQHNAWLGCVRTDPVKVTLPLPPDAPAMKRRAAELKRVREAFATSQAARSDELSDDPAATDGNQ